MVARLVQTKGASSAVNEVAVYSNMYKAVENLDEIVVEYVIADAFDFVYLVCIGAFNYSILCSVVPEVKRLAKK